MRPKTVAVIGGGIVGLASAYKLLHAPGRPSVVVYEKEDQVGQHQSGHNSGVLHCGLHYRPGSLKAKLAVAGIREMTQFCEAHDIAHELCGKVVVASAEKDLPRLDELERRGRANGLTGLRRLSVDELREREPHARGLAALLVPEEGLADFPGVCWALQSEIERMGGEVVCGTRVEGLRTERDGWRVLTSAGDRSADFVLGCGGLFADRIARMAGARIQMSIVPFRGEYYTLRSERAHLVRHMIYPVPDPDFPFLGVHLHRRLDGSSEGGPTAVLAFAREGYSLGTLNGWDMADAFFTPGLWRFASLYPQMCASELGRSLSLKSFARALRRLVPEVRDQDLVRGRTGVRAQGLKGNGRLVEDFHLVERDRDLHVLNAPSPAATASLAIGGAVASKVLARL
ncbi:MAG: L-2-hydroxyglutarate oxidase [Longimicrobiales bacterium]